MRLVWYVTGVFKDSKSSRYALVEEMKIEAKDYKEAGKIAENTPHSKQPDFKLTKIVALVLREA